MSAKTVIFVLCAQALLIQSALSQVCGRSAFASGLGSYGLIGSASPFGLNSVSLRNSIPCNGLAANSLAIDSAVIPAVEITPTSGGSLPVTSASPTAPNSLIVASENVYEGTLEVGGDLPFIGTVGLEGLLPSAGTGAVNHACGNGATRMVSQDGATIASGFGSAAGIASGSVFNGIGALGNTAAAPFRFGSGLTGLGYPTKDFGSCNSGFNAYPGVNNAFGFGAYGNSVGSPYGGAIAPAGAYGAIGSGAAYGGAGEGNVAVAGELPVAGNAAVAGQVPIMGAVRFGGDVPAAGAVAITGNCACGCGSPYMY